MNHENGEQGKEDFYLEFKKEKNTLSDVCSRNGLLYLSNKKPKKYCGNKKNDYICAMTNKDFNHRCGTVFGLAILFVLLAGLMMIGIDLLRSFLFEPTMTDAVNLLDALFDSSLNALKGN